MNPPGSVVKVCRMRSPPSHAIRFHNLLWPKRGGSTQAFDSGAGDKDLAVIEVGPKHRRKKVKALTLLSDPVDICDFDGILAEHQDHH